MSSRPCHSFSLARVNIALWTLCGKGRQRRGVGYVVPSSPARDPLYACRHVRSRTQKLSEALRSRTQSCNRTAGEEDRNRHGLEFPFDLMVKFLYSFPLSLYGNAAVRFMRRTADTS